MSNLQSHTEEYVRMLLDEKAPLDGICSHHGLQFRSGDLTVSIWTRRDSPYTVFCVSNDLWQFDKDKKKRSQNGTTKRTHNARKYELKCALEDIFNREVKELDSWNGGDGNRMFSIVFDVTIPSLLNAINAYHHEVKDVFSYNPKEQEAGLRFHNYVADNEPEFCEFESARQRKKEAREQLVAESYEKISALKQLGFNDIVDTMMPLLDPRMQNLFKEDQS